MCAQGGVPKGEGCVPRGRGCVPRGVSAQGGLSAPVHAGIHPSVNRISDTHL